MRLAIRGITISDPLSHQESDHEVAERRVLLGFVRRRPMAGKCVIQIPHDSNSHSTSNHHGFDNHMDHENVNNSVTVGRKIPPSELRGAAVCCAFDVGATPE
jgi:hypothetical protein